MTDDNRQRMDAAEFLRLPETNLPVELLNGEVHRRPANDVLHQETVGSVYVFLLQRTASLGGKGYFAPVDVEFDAHNVVQSDVLWLAPEGACRAFEGKRLLGAPDLVVEVLSPGTAHKDRREKFHLYQRCGVREYWLVDPRDRLVEVWTLSAGKFQRLDVYGTRDTLPSPLLGDVRVGALFPA